MTLDPDKGKNGESLLLFSYPNSPDKIQEGLNRLETYLGHKPFERTLN